MNNVLITSHNGIVIASVWVWDLPWIKLTNCRDMGYKGKTIKIKIPTFLFIDEATESVIQLLWDFTCVDILGI